MEKTEQLGSAEAIKRRSDIHAVLASYIGRNSTVTELIKNIPELAGSTQPRELLDILLYEQIDPNKFLELATVAREYLSSLEDKDRIALLDKATLF